MINSNCTQIKLEQPDWRETEDAVIDKLTNRGKTYRINRSNWRGIQLTSASRIYLFDFPPKSPNMEENPNKKSPNMNIPVRRPAKTYGKSGIQPSKSKCKSQASAAGKCFNQYLTLAGGLPIRQLGSLGGSPQGRALSSIGPYLSWDGPDGWDWAAVHSVIWRDDGGVFSNLLHTPDYSAKP